jgi:hypothetical protein
MAYRQLLAFRFGSDSKFEGQLVGALERVESGGAMRVRDGTGGVTGQLLAFRLDPGERQAATKRALSGQNGETVQALAEVLEPGAAFAAILIEHAWADALGDAVARLGGSEAATELVDAARLADVAPRLLTAAKASD